MSSITLRIYSPTIINITFPQYHVYKVVTISPSNNASVQLKFPVIQVTLIVVTVVIIGLSIWKESIRDKKVISTVN